MKSLEILESLTTSQREEFDSDIKAIITQIIEAHNNVDFDKPHEVKTNIRLENDKVLLNVTLDFSLSPRGTVTGKLKKVERFKNMDEYLDSMNENRRLGDEWWTGK